jgi:hypothetical protein
MYTRDYDLGEIAQKHSNSAAELWNIRESYLSLLTDIKNDALKPDEIISKRDKLQSELYNIYKGSPRTINKAYKAATIGLKRDEELFFKSEEIDKLLPEDLRRVK